LTVLRNFAALQTDLPYDGVDDENDWIVWPRANVVATIGDGLRRRGYTVSEPDGQQHLGWWAYIYCPGGRRAHIQVSDLGDYLLLVIYDRAGFFRRRVFKRSETAYRDLLVDVNAVLAEGPFRDVSWYTRAEYEEGRDLAPGAGSPVG
jgi:hypothetical protein